MSAIVARLSTPLPQAVIRRRAPFSTTTSLNNSANTVGPQASGWWRNLQPKTRRTLKIGLGIAAIVDVVTLEYYLYPDIFGVKKE